MSGRTAERKRHQFAEEKGRIFSFDLKEESEEECLTERKRVSDHRSDGSKGSLPQPGPPAHPRNTEYPNIKI